MSDSLRDQLADIAERYATRDRVLAVTLSGSRTSPLADERSDLDLYVYDVDGQSPMDLRRAIANALADTERPIELGNTTWEPGDEWFHRALGIKLDTMFRSPQWIAETLDRVLIHHRAATGYTTCFWYNVLKAQVLYERRGWYSALRQRASIPYPEPLARAIIALNRPLLSGSHSSYRAQIALAIERRDRVSIHHRTAAFLASYFDILFAINRQPHPGEKRLLAHVERLCPKRPSACAETIEALLIATAAPWPAMDILASVDQAIADLDALL